MFGYAWWPWSVMKFCESVVRCLCICRCFVGEDSMGVFGKVYRNFVECVVW